MPCDIHAAIERKKKYDFGNGAGYTRWLNAGDPDINRGYEMFAVLAGVRNSLNIIPIAEPRGMPEDASGFVEDVCRQYGEDGHSHSWLTLAEIKAFNPTQVIEDNHLILSRDDSGAINSTCASTTGQHLGRVGTRKVFELWGRGEFDRLIAEMERVKREGDADEDVRLVFWFDN